MAEAIVQLLEYSLRMHKALGYSFSATIKLLWYCTPVIPPLVIWELETGDQEFKIILDYIVSLRPASAT